MRTAARVSLIVPALILLMLTAGCTRQVRSPCDELQMNRWGTQTQNGNVLELTFDDRRAVFSAVNDSFALTVSGVFSADDTTLVIYDDATGMPFRFSYMLHGDGIELTYRDGTVLLNKK